MDETKLKQKLEVEFGNDEKLSVAVLTLVLVAAQVFLFLHKNCGLMSKMVKRSAKKKGFLYRKFIKENVYPKLNDSDLTEEQKELAIEKVRQLIIEDKLDEFLPS